MKTLALVSRRRRAASLAYEAFLLGAVLFVSGFVLVPITQPFPSEARRLALQGGLMLVAGVYCVMCWTRGHTLPMKTWGIRLVMQDGAALTRADAIKRFLAAIPSVGLLGVGFFWSLVDPEKQFLHDRLAGTRLVDNPSTPLEPTNETQTRGQEQQGGQ